MTVRQVVTASRGFERPYGSLSVARADLLALVREGLLQRQEIPRVGPGECERLYFLSRRAGRVVPELRDLPKGAAAFRPVPLTQFEHAMGVASFLSLVHRDVAGSQGRARLLRALGDRQLRIPVDARVYGLENGFVIPDGTVLLELDGQLQLLFLELMNRGGVIRPGIPASIARSFAAKLWRYKALVKSLGNCGVLRSLFREHGRELPPGFRVLVVSTRGADHLEHLRQAAGDFRTMVYFARLVSLETSSSMLTEGVWRLPSGLVRGISD
ncbi:MAG: hypothetical protein H6712_24285 [Myxococcales bacterium]|nr:hypothetical protein [Myxococcales bacterium]